MTQVPVFDYLRDPAAIYQRSFEQVRAATDLTALPPELHKMALRLVHACAMPDIVDDLRWTADPAGSGRTALLQGAPILVDCQMVASGITRSVLGNDNAVICTLPDQRVPDLAKQQQTTRSAAAVELWLPHLAGAVVTIGNAPTTLFRLLEVLLQGGPKPAAILAFPVGFVGAAESKEALLDAALDVPFMTLRGRRGGSALAAAAVNSLADSSPGQSSSP